MIEGLLGGKSIQAESQLVEMHWPDGYRSLEDGQSSVQGKKALAYLLGRGFKKEVLYEMQFGYCATGFYSGRIIIPTFIDGRLVYWQARDYTGRKSAKDKILNPRSGLVGNGKSEVLFNYDTARQYDCVIVVESWGSCLSVGPYGTAVNGKHISQQQLRLLGRMEAKRFIVLFDYGVGAMSGWDAAEALNAIKPTSVALLPWGDPNEVPASVRNESIRSCIPYSKAAHVRYRLEQLGQSYK
jgi:DNA primase